MLNIWVQVINLNPLRESEGSWSLLVFMDSKRKYPTPHNSLCNLQDIAGGEIDPLFVLEECIKKKIGVTTLIRAQKKWDEKT